MGIGLSFLAVVILVFLALVGVGAAKLDVVFGVVFPYLALLTFIVGFIYRVVNWARSPVPFRITTSCGQQKTLPWIKSNDIENPSNALGVVVRMALEILLFRSLFRNTKAETKGGPSVVYGSAKWLWLAGLAFHISFFVIIMRHFRFFAEPVPFFINWAAELDGLFEIAVPTIYLTDMLFIASAAYLFLRRVVIPQMRYISLASDYFPLFLLFGVGLSGVLMRQLFKVDLHSVKELAMGWLQFHPTVPEGIGLSFYVHLFLVCAFIAYFPFSKLMHLAGIFLSPTRNLANNNRMQRHINPWNPPVKVHTYAEYEDEFREKMKSVGLPVEKE
jgi:nitrate reductase gamma subunit